MARRDDDVRRGQIEAVRVAIVEAVQKAFAIGGKTQRELATLTGLDQPRVSRLMSGTTNAVAAERALAILTSLGYDVTVVIEPARSGAGHVRCRMRDL